MYVLQTYSNTHYAQLQHCQSLTQSARAYGRPPASCYNNLWQLTQNWPAQPVIHAEGLSPGHEGPGGKKTDTPDMRADRQAGSQTDTKTDRQTHKQADRQTGR